MPINCDIILQWSATPEQLSVLGAALWRWCTRAAGNNSFYQYLDNQALADLIAGKLPAPGRTVRQAERGVHVGIRDEVSHDRQAAIDSLRREMPAEGIEDILIDGKSWGVVESKETASVAMFR
jgi:hypothetical protein